MDELLERLQNQKKYLQSFLLKLESVPEQPDGHLRVSKNGKKYGYYHYVSTDDNRKKATNKYIPYSNRDLYTALAQKDYCIQMKRYVKKQLSVIDSFIRSYNPTCLDQQYEQLHCARKQLIDPLFMPRSEYIKKWIEEDYEKKGFELGTPEILTERGERVRSKSEKIIADYLYRKEIPYHYEYPLVINGMGRIYPDFKILNKRTLREYYWEHFGMMDHSQYVSDNLPKLNRYIQAGYYPGKNLLITFESQMCPLNTKVIQNIVEEYLE